ncbi:MAG: FMN-binding glutamate synthase family protein [Bacteroidetes bacterium]|nr:MAG: FMN-binding glutamate synthase family protein [Bacteroidota bacterium]
MRKWFFIVFGGIFLFIFTIGYYYSFYYQLLWVVVPLFLLGLYDIIQQKHAILRNFPVIGHFRYLFEAIRPEIQQYFIESDTNGTPFSRIYRSIAYERAKHETDTIPFGTQFDVYRVGHEWINHSLTPTKIVRDIKVKIGGKHCSKPYNASYLNISAMSFGALSKNAVLALNKGAAMGGFYHNTGEGSISEYHLKYGGDLVWQIGTGYFGCRTKDGKFAEEAFKEKALLPQVKMIELKLSQGAKPAHGGILPACKNTPEIAKIRGVEPYTTVYSPPAHTAFSTPVEMMKFIQRLRELSDGKPVGFKLCIGNPIEFIKLAKAMLKTGITPDFITVDGAEGGTGAAPMEFSNSVGMPMKDAIVFVKDVLDGYGLKEEIKIIASGKIITGFHVLRALALGADLCNSARGMMFALGCIQALRCNTDFCPSGVATQNPDLYKGLHVDIKAERIKNFHEETVKAFFELVEACGVNNPEGITRHHIYRRVNENTIQTYEDMYPYVPEKAFLKNIPTDYLKWLEKTD